MYQNYNHNHDRILVCANLVVSVFPGNFGTPGSQRCLKIVPMGFKFPNKCSFDSGSLAWMEG